MGLRVHEIILIGNGFYNSPHRKFNMRARNFISHTRVETESHKHRCWRVSAPLINIASLQTCSDLTPEVHSDVGHDLSVKSLGSQIKSWYFNLVIKVCHPLTLVQSKALSLFWNVPVQEWWTCDACVDLCPMPTEGTITWLWHFSFTLCSNISSETFSVPCSRKWLGQLIRVGIRFKYICCSWWLLSPLTFQSLWLRPLNFHV